MRILIAAFGAVAVISIAQGEVVRFDNSAGPFVWRANAGDQANHFFDPTLPASNQQAFTVARSLEYSAFLGSGSNTVAADSINATGSDIRVARGTSLVTVDGPQPGQQTTFQPAATFLSGEAVVPGADYSQASVRVGYFNPGLGRHNLLGDHAIVGFRVTLGDGLPHFGFVELDYRVGPLGTPPGSTVMMYQPVAWAYESLPNTPITVPVPAAGLLAAAALGAAALRRRR